MNRDLIRFEDMCWALGDSLSRDQQDRLISFAVQNIAQSDWNAAAEIALFAGCGAVYGELRMRMAECGEY